MLTGLDPVCASAEPSGWHRQLMGEAVGQPGSRELTKVN